MITAKGYVIVGAAVLILVALIVVAVIAVSKKDK